MADYFVRIDDGKELRRTLLESSKTCIQILKKEHEVVKVREQKQALVNEIRAQLKELNFLFSSIEKDLPLLTKKELGELNPGAVESMKKKKVPKKTAAKKAVPIVVEKPPEMSKVEKLEHSLRMIEGKLNKL